MATLGEYIGAGSGTTKLLLHLNGNSTDSSGNGNNGTDTNISYGLGYGKFGQGASFNGSTSYISHGNVAGFEYNQAFTIICWMKNNGTIGQNIVSKQQSTSPYAGYGISTNTTGYVQVFLYNNGTNGSFIKTSSRRLNDKIHLVVMTYDGSNTIGGLNMYVDGVLENTTVDGSIVFSASILSTAPFQVSGRGGGNYLFNGTVDEVIVESRAWSAKEIQKYYTSSKGRFAL